jgi:hypothetical protein
MQDNDLTEPRNHLSEQIRLGAKILSQLDRRRRRRTRQPAEKLRAGVANADVKDSKRGISGKIVFSLPNGPTRSARIFFLKIGAKTACFVEPSWLFPAVFCRFLLVNPNFGMRVFDASGQNSSIPTLQTPPQSSASA